MLQIDKEKCTGCRLCEMMCSFRHEGECSTAKSRIKILKDEEFGNCLVLVCMNCEDAPCVASCPTEAFKKDDNSGIVALDESLCIGCEACIGVCPMETIVLDKDKNTVFKCDLCGGDPECVKWCTRGAIKENDIGWQARQAYIEQANKMRSPNSA
ncbi:MAG: 4Fe-4S dicluster domain-containing protein [Chloroflexi bacterium]|nr:4Fe-4S dicluster domain-containing protein [Chloroflexota bacterium]